MVSVIVWRAETKVDSTYSIKNDSDRVVTVRQVVCLNVLAGFFSHHFNFHISSGHQPTGFYWQFGHHGSPEVMATVRMDRS